MSTANHVNLEVGREGIGFGVRRKHFDPIHARLKELLGRPVYCHTTGAVVLLRSRRLKHWLHLQLGYLRTKENPEQMGTIASPCLLPMRVAEVWTRRLLF
jgi:hypothetical protein